MRRAGREILYRKKRPKLSMKKDLKAKRISIHLYDPKLDGVGAYDIHYINAFKKNKTKKLLSNENSIKRYAA